MACSCSDSDSHSNSNSNINKNSNGNNNSDVNIDGYSLIIPMASARHLLLSNMFGWKSKKEGNKAQQIAQREITKSTRKSTKSTRKPTTSTRHHNEAGNDLDEFISGMYVVCCLILTRKKRSDKHVDDQQTCQEQQRET